jgi:hypothetical protein
MEKKISDLSICYILFLIMLFLTLACAHICLYAFAMDAL